MFRFVTSKEDFEGLAKKDPDKSELDCFLEFISGELSPSAKAVLRNSQTRYARYDLLLEKVVVKASNRKFKTRRDYEAYTIKKIVDFEVQQHKGKDFNFADGGLNFVVDDFFMLHEYLSNYKSGFFRALCSRYGHWWLSKEENDELAQLPKKEQISKKVEKVQGLLLPVWSFFVAMCHALQHGENQLTANDAVWLGLIDEVLGEKTLPCRRMVWEYTPDAEDNDKEEKSEGGVTGDISTGAVAGT